MPDLPPPPEPAPSAVERLATLAASRPPQAILAVAGLAGAALAVAVFAGSFRPTPPPEISLPRATPAVDAPVQRVAATNVVVHVAGAVVHPGVYRLSGSDRVADAIDEAGGPTPEADVHQLNLAAPLADGDRIYVPRAGEATPAGATNGASAGMTAAKVDLNRATAAEFEALPGVGPATAAAIISYRDEHGPFRSVEQLLEVPGIGPAKLDAVRDLVRV